MFKLILIVMAILLLVSCADPTRLEDEPNRDRAGFWSGLWHGLTVIFSYIGSLFNSDIAVYEVYNTGNWYVFGFLMGAQILFASISVSRRK